MQFLCRVNVLLILILFSYSAFAVDPRLNWNTIESKNFYIHYADGYESLAQKTANLAEQAHKKLQKEFNWQPEDKTHLVVSDETDSANGFATPINFNKSVLFVAPPDSANSLEDFDNWLETLITHEYTHILHLDKASGVVEMMRGIFGRQFLFFPNAYQPGWLVEGLSTFYETDIEKGIGRGQSTTFKMMMRTEVENGIKPVSQVNLPIRSWPMGTVSYLYGVNFYQFLHETYGEQGVADLIDNYSDNIIPFRINSNAQSVLNKDIDELWEAFSVWLNQRYQAEITVHNNSGIVEGKKISDLGYNTGPVEIKNQQGVYFVAGGAFDHTKLMQRVDGESRFVAELSRGATINYHEKSGVLVVQKDFCDEYNKNGDIYIVKNEGVEALTKCGRYRTAAWSADGESIFAVKVSKGKSTLQQLSKQGEIMKTLWQGNETDIVSQIKTSPDGKFVLAAVFRKEHGWNIEEFDLVNAQWLPITDDWVIDMYPSYSDNGQSILFSSERTGRYQIYRYQKLTKSMQQLTNVVSGAFNPIEFSAQSPLFYVGYNHNGRDIYQLDDPGFGAPTIEKNNITTEKKSVEMPVSKTQTSKAKKYSAFASLDPRWWLPIIVVGEDRSELGFTTSASDALGVHSYQLNLAYDTKNSWPLGSISYAYTNRFAMGYQRSMDLYRFETGELALSRKIEDMFLSLGYSDLGVEASTRYQLGIVVSKGSDEGGGLGVSSLGVSSQGVPTRVNTEDSLLGAAIIFNNTQNYPRSISQSDGRNIRVLVETSEVLDSSFSGEVYTLDWREYLHLGQQHVIAARFVQGWGTQQPQLFRLGGETGEFNVFSLLEPISEPLFNKRDYALRGYAEGLPQLAGRRMQLATLEWRFPGSLIERGFMSPPLGIIQWSGALFAETGAAYEESADGYYSSVGFELQAEVNLFYGLTSRMRLGFANGLDSDIGEPRMYFSLGATF